jgi:peptide/nickel transport system substrate-binding protein
MTAGLGGVERLARYRLAFPWRHFAGAILVLAAAWACTAEPTCEGEWCGTVVIASPAEADVLLPAVSQLDVGHSIGDMIFVKLADIGPELNSVDDTSFVPKLAESWTFEDSVTLVFSLHPHARWHDGRPVRAADVVFTFDVYTDTLVGAPARPRLSQIRSVTARDSLTVVFTFARPYPEQLFDAVYHMWILPRHLLEGVPRQEFASSLFGRDPVGAGPYRFVRWVPGESIELEGDSTFFLGRPGIRRVIWQFTGGEPPAALRLLLSGEADLLNYLWAEAQTEVEASPDLRVVPYLSSTTYSYLAFNFLSPEDPTRPHPLFADRRLRRAITMAVNREAVVRAVDGPDGILASGPMGLAYWINDVPYEQIPYDTARARRELAALGWVDSNGDGILDRDGMPLSFELLVPLTSTPRRRGAVIVQEQLRRLGIAMQIGETDILTFQERQQAGDFDMFFGTFGGDPSPSTIAEAWTEEAIGGFNYGHFVDPEFDRAVTAALQARTLQAARARWTEAITRINEDAAAVWMSASRPRAGVHRRLENVTIRGDNMTATLPQWRIAPSAMIPRDRIAP